MNILIVSQYFWPEEFRINDCAAELKARGHEVVVLTGIPNYPKGEFFPGYRWLRPRREKYHGITVVRVPLIARGQRQTWRLALNYLSFAFFASMLGPFYCHGKFDVVFAYEPSPITVVIPAIVLKKLKRVPLLLWVQDLWPESLTAIGAVRSHMVVGAIGKLVRWIYGQCDQILVQSKGFIEPVKAMGGAAKKIIYVPNWAEEFYKPVSHKHGMHEEEKMPKGFRVMFAGNIGAAQDFSTILGAAQRLKHERDIHFVILGDGRMSGWVEEEVERRDLRRTVHLLGRHPVETMPRYFALADAMLVTLKKDPIFALTIPGKVQSYLACGRPIIAALDGEGARVVEEAGAGIACVSQDPDALSRAILAMARMGSAEREKLGRCARTYYENNFDRRKLIDRIELLMNELVHI